MTLFPNKAYVNFGLVPKRKNIFFLESYEFHFVKDSHMKCFHTSTFRSLAALITSFQIK